MRNEKMERIINIENSVIKHCEINRAYRIDLMDEIEIIETKRKDAPRKYEWKNSQKFLIANPFFYSGKKEDIVIGFEEQQITQVVDWFGTEENGLFECLGTYFITIRDSPSTELMSSTSEWISLAVCLISKGAETISPKGRMITLLFFLRASNVSVLMW